MPQAIGVSKETRHSTPRDCAKSRDRGHHRLRPAADDPGTRRIVEHLFRQFGDQAMVSGTAIVRAGENFDPQPLEIVDARQVLAVAGAVAEGDARHIA